MSGQGEAETEQAAAGAAEGATKANQAGTAEAPTTAEIQRLKVALDKAENKLFKMREDKRLRDEETAEAARKAGEYEPLLKQREDRIAELEGFEADAKAWRAFREREAAAIEQEAEAAKLDDEAKAALAAIPDLGMRRAMLTRLVGKPEKERPAEHPAGAGATSGPTKSYADMTPEEIAEARKAKANGKKAGVLSWF